MTMTESPPVDAVVDHEPSDERPAAGIYSLLTTNDHKTVGRLFIACSLLFALGTVIVGALVGLERIDTAQADDIFGGLNAYLRMWTLYRVAFVLFVVHIFF